MKVIIAEKPSVARDIALIVGQINSTHRIILFAGNICRLSAGAGQIDVQQPCAADAGKHQPRQ